MAVKTKDGKFVLSPGMKGHVQIEGWPADARGLLSVPGSIHAVVPRPWERATIEHHLIGGRIHELRYHLTDQRTGTRSLVYAHRFPPAGYEGSMYPQVWHTSLQNDWSQPVKMSAGTINEQRFREWVDEILKRPPLTPPGGFISSGS